jgi:hypothetical protein
MTAQPAAPQPARQRFVAFARAAFTVAAALAIAASAAAQGRIGNAKLETRQASRPLEAEINAVAARGAAAWIGYRLPMVAGPRQMCCYDTVSDAGTCCGRCRLEAGGGVTLDTGDADASARRGGRIMLEPPSDFIVLVRVEAGAVSRIRTFTPDCDLDAGGLPVVWLEGVKADDSVAWLSRLVTASPDSGERHDRIGRSALAAVALTSAPSADRALEAFVAPQSAEWLRGQAVFWIGSTRGEPGVRILARMLQQDPSDKVREKVTFGLSVSKASSALTTLIAAAKNDRSTRVRGQALFWLGQKAGDQAVAAIASAIDNDPETEVKKKAVFALSQLPKDEGVPKLIEVAKTNRNPAVRKQAFFWLGQSKDPRAVQFFEDVLLKK